jgi:hypothetical protein
VVVAVADIQTLKVQAVQVAVLMRLLEPVLLEQQTRVVVVVLVILVVETAEAEL